MPCPTDPLFRRWSFEWENRHEVSASTQVPVYLPVCNILTREWSMGVQSLPGSPERLYLTVMAETYSTWWLCKATATAVLTLGQVGYRLR